MKTENTKTTRADTTYPTTATAILRAAREILSCPNSFVREGLAYPRDLREGGRGRHAIVEHINLSRRPEHPKARKWSATGAILRAAGPQEAEKWRWDNPSALCVQNALIALAAAIHTSPKPIADISFNDAHLIVRNYNRAPGRRRVHIVKAFDRAIAIAEIQHKQGKKHPSA